MPHLISVRIRRDILMNRQHRSPDPGALLDKQQSNTLVGVKRVAFYLIQVALADRTEEPTGVGHLP
jgi:hypothetical protein